MRRSTRRGREKQRRADWAWARLCLNDIFDASHPSALVLSVRSGGGEIAGTVELRQRLRPLTDDEIEEHIFRRWHDLLERLAR